MSLVVLVAYVAFNIWLGAKVYIDVTRTRRSVWWLVLTKFCPPVGVLYLLTHRARVR